MFNRPKLNPQNILAVFYEIKRPEMLRSECNDRIDSKCCEYSTSICRVDHPEKWIKILIDLNYVNEQTEHFGDTVLMWACIKGRDDLVKTLLAAGANPDLKNKYNETALDLAVNHRYPDCVALFFEKPSYGYCEKGY